MAEKDAFKDFLGSVGLFIFFVVEIVLVTFSLFGQGGAESETNLFVVLLSLGLGIFGALLIVLLKLSQFLIKKFNAEKNYGWMGAIVHDVEESPLPVNKKGFTWMKNPFIFALVMIIPSSILGVIQVFQQTFFTALPRRVPQQITEAAKGILSSIPADFEIWIPVAIAGLLISIFIWQARTKRISTATSQILIYIAVPIIYTIIWTVNHFFRHGASTPAIQFVILFGLISAYLLVLFRSVIPVLILKITNNFYQFLSAEIQANETILMITIVLNVILVAITVLIFTLRSRKATG